MKRFALILAALPLAALSANVHAQAAPAAKPTMPQVCANCHDPEPNKLRGVFENVSFKAQSIQVRIDTVTEIIRFDDKTLKVVDVDKKGGAPMLDTITKNREILVAYAVRDGQKVATEVSFKGPIKLGPEKLVGYAEIVKLVAAGPEAGGYTLIDSRPLPLFQAGAIPTAINLPYPAFDKFLDRLPKDKAKLLVFYCQGVTCMMSPSSLRRAEAMGYTNVKVYREGMPEWSQKNVGVLSSKFLKEAWIDKDMPHVLLDVRPADQLQSGFIKGAVSMPFDKLAAALPTFPDKSLRAPIMVYDGENGALAFAVAKRINAAGYPLASGAAATNVAYAPKPRPGEIPIAEFTKIAGATPPDVLILDVRNRDEANTGMIKGAKLIPDEELLARMGEVPKDKRIIAHCTTGVRAEMAYHKLKEKGYNVGFVKADVDVQKNGKFKVTPN
jgi:rhodanese-related sulfurtransferase